MPTHEEFVTYRPTSLSDCDAALHAVLNLAQWWGNQAPPAFLGDYEETTQGTRRRIRLVFEDCEDCED